MGKGDDKQTLPRWGRPGNNLKIGLVGMPNVGKSSTFNLFGQNQVAAENFPFCTIDPADCVVPVPDERFEKLCTAFNPKSRVPAVLHVRDIAGLVKNAADGAGLGNQFLSHIKEVDAIFHVCRAFVSKTIEHVEGDVNPVRDFEIIGAELRKKDVEFLTTAIENLKKKMRAKASKEQQEEMGSMEKALALVESGVDIRAGEWKALDIITLNKMQLLTAKPVVYLVNISKQNYQKMQNKWFKEIKAWIKENAPTDKLIPYSVKFEQELLNMDDAARAEYLAANPKTPSMIPRIIQVGFKALDCLNFFTCGPDEVRAWTLRAGKLAPQAAGVIHGDFEKNFIKTEVYNYEDFTAHGDEKGVKDAGKYLTKGKDYLVKDGDIMFFLHGAGGAKKK